jgi:multiple sugar transport system ATP-binding protein
MDEPLSNLDAKLRVQTRTQIASLQRRLGITTVYVTHDQVEAMTMGDRVAVLKDGILQQCDSPRRSSTTTRQRVRGRLHRLAAMNLFDVPVVDGGVKFGDHTHPVDRSWLADAGSHVTLGVRPEDLEISATGGGLPITIDVVEELGADAYVYGTIEGSSPTDKPIIARTDGRTPPAKGSVVRLSPKPDHVHLFNADTGLRLGD